MKIAVQFFGHLRTFNECYMSINENLLDKYDCDVFIHTWDTIDHNTKTWHQFHLDQPYTLDKDLITFDLKRKYKKVKLIKIDHQINEPDGYITSQGKTIAKSGIVNMMNSMHRVNRLRKWYEKEKKLSYDIVVFIRPDIKLLIIPDLNKVTDDSFYTSGFFKKKTVSVDFKFIGASDVLFYAKKEVIDKIFSAPDIMKKQLLSEETSKYGPEYSFIYYIQSLGNQVKFNELILGRDFDILRFFKNKIVSFDKRIIYRDIEMNTIQSDVINVPDCKPKVSVIVPVYNVSNYISLCVNSILKSTLRDIEIICVDDGSTDSSGLICDMLAEKFRKVSSYHKRNGGLSDARNFGVSKSHGEYICFVDSDDIICPEMLEKLYNACLVDNTKVAICNFTIWNPLSNTRRYIKDLNIDKVFIGPNGKYSPLYLNDCYHHLAWRKIYHKSLFKKVYNPIGIYHEDIGFWYSVLAVCDRVSIVTSCLYLYRRDPSRTTISNDKNIVKIRKFDFLKSYEFALNKINQLSDPSRIDSLRLALLVDCLKMPFDHNSKEFFDRKRTFLSNFVYLRNKIDKNLNRKLDYYLYPEVRHIKYNLNIFKLPFIKILKQLLASFCALKMTAKSITHKLLIWFLSLCGVAFYTIKFILRKSIKNA